MLDVLDAMILWVALALAIPTGDAPPPATIVDPQPVGGFTPLCQGPWIQADASAPYRGVSAEDNGSARCCPLAGEGGATRARVDLVTTASANPGMNPDFDSPPAPPFAELEAVVTTSGFLLRPTDVKTCARPAPEARDVCRNVGRYLWQRGMPVRR